LTPGITGVRLDKMRHTIREQEPERPSTRLNTMLNADLTTTATHRQTDALKLVHLLRGDIDWIVMKALEKIAPGATNSEQLCRRYSTLLE